MADRDTRMLDLAATIADGGPVDWDAAESSAASDSERRQIGRLRLVHQLAAGRDASSSSEPDLVHDSSRQLPHPNGGVDADETAPEVWGPLRVIERIGRGRFGDVYRAWDPRLDRDVALKLLRRRHEQNDAVTSYTIEEGRLLAKIRHPNVVTVFGAERIESRVGLWMELVRGQTLEQIVTRGRLSADEAVSIGVDVCQALDAVHRAGLVHRDVKAQNVMRDDAGRVVLMDFGTGREVDVNAPPELAGTPLYLAPEVLQGAPASAQSDLYSVGVLLFYLVSGTFPVSGRTLAQIREGHRRSDKPRTVARLSGVSERLKAVIERALSDDLEARFSTAVDVAEALKACRDSSTDPTVELRSGSRRLGWPVVATAFLAVLALLLVAAGGRDLISRVRGVATPGVVVRQVWSGVGIDGSGTPSPDGRYLTFTDWETGDLAVRDLQAGTSRRLTDTGGWVVSGDYAEVSAISPDGQSVAYLWFAQASRKFEVRLMALSGDDSSSRVVLRTELADYVAPIGWMPDARHLAVLRRSGNRTEFGELSIADGIYRVITALDERLQPDAADLSPDGRYLTYQASGEGNDTRHDIFVVGTDGSPPNLVVRSQADDVTPLWSPDGSSILFLSDRTGTMSLWTVHVQGGTATAPAVLLRADTGPIVPLGISRAGSLYYMHAGHTRRDVYIAEVNGLSAAKAPARVSERFVNSTIGPAWSSDGESLLYYSFRASNSLIVRSTTTGHEREVAVPLRLIAPFQAAPQWFPDDRSVLVLGRERPGAGAALYRLWLDDGRTDLLTRIDGASSFALSRDGQAIYYAVQQTNQRANSGRLMRYDIGTTRSRTLKQDEWFISVAISPDGRHVAYLKSVRRRDVSDFYSAVEVMPSEGGVVREIYRDAPWQGAARYNTLAWTPDGRHLMFARDDGRLWAVPVTGGTPRDMGISMNAQIKTPTIRPDGRQIAFAAVETDNNEVWVLENVLASAGLESRRQR